MAKYTTYQQHEPLRTPEGWSPNERKLIAQLEEILDDLYRRFNRLKLGDLSESLRTTILDSAERVSKIIIDLDQITATVSSKADIETVNGLSQRMSAAELRITDEAIVSTVTTSAPYQSDREQVYDDMDIKLGYRVEVTAGTAFLSERAPETTLTARVWHGGEDTTDALAASRFRWRRESGDSMADAVWDDAHAGVKSVTVTTADVCGQASFRCELLDEEA